jgi:hypothetical protein
MKPSIFPRAMSAVAFDSPCGPPAFRSFASWYGRWQTSFAGSGTQTANSPFGSRGKPSAPGYVPK